MGIIYFLRKLKHLRCLHSSSNVEYITICWRGKPPAKRHSISIPLVTENWPTGSSCRSWPWSLVGALDFGFLHLAFQLQQIQCDLDLIDWLRRMKVPIIFMPRTIWILLLPRRVQLKCIFHREQWAILKDFHAGTQHVSYINHKHQQVEDDDDGGAAAPAPAPASASSSIFRVFHSFLRWKIILKEKK